MHEISGSWIEDEGDQAVVLTAEGGATYSSRRS